MRILVFLIVICTIPASANERSDTAKLSEATTLIKQIEENLSNNPNIKELKFLITQCKIIIDNSESDPEEKKAAKTMIEAAKEEINENASNKVEEAIAGIRPLTAVLFSGQDRNSYEVIKKPGGGDADGVVNQNQSGDTGGVLMAGEAPFAYPAFNGTVFPVGAWFGVRLQNGASDDVSGVDLAAGLSLSLISSTKTDSPEFEPRFGIVENARLLIGAIYGDEISLGTGVTEGDDVPLGDQIPLHIEKDISFTLGIGFRF